MSSTYSAENSEAVNLHSSITMPVIESRGSLPYGPIRAATRDPIYLLAIVDNYVLSAIFVILGIVPVDVFFIGGDKGRMGDIYI